MTRLRRLALTVVVLVPLVACQEDMQAWRARLAAPNVQRLLGLWEVRMRLDRRETSPDTSRVAPELIRVGEIAITLNENRLNAPGSDGPPMLFGTFDIDFRRLDLRVANYTGVPELVGRVSGDSILFKLAPEADLPVALRGAWSGDSVAGRWTAHQRAGIDASGDFTIRRR